MTPDLFDRQSIADKFTRTGQSIVPPTAAELAASRRDDGMQRAARYVRKTDVAWMDKAVGYVRLHALVHRTFMTEDAKAMAEQDGFAQCGDPRVWGNVMRQAQRDGIVVHDGYAPANSSNRAPKCRWRSLVIA